MAIAALTLVVAFALVAVSAPRARADSPTPLVSVSCTSPWTYGNGTPVCRASISGYAGSVDGEILTFSHNNTGLLVNATYNSWTSITCRITSGGCAIYYLPWVVGTHQITASYSGDANNAASSGTFDIVAQKATVTVESFSCGEVIGSMYYGGMTTVGATDECQVQTNSPIGYGEVMTLSSSGGGTFGSDTCSLVSVGYAWVCSTFPSYTPTSAAGSPQRITLTYAGDADYNPGSWTAQLSVNRAPTTTNVVCSSSGSSLDCTAVVSGAYGSVVGDNFAFTATSPGAFFPTNGVCSIASGSACSVTFTPSSGSAAPISASFSGDVNNTPSSGSSAKAPTQVSVSCPSSEQYESPFECQATVTGANPTGTVDASTDYLSNTNVLSCNSQASGSLLCYVYIQAVKLATYTLTVDYPGDGNNLPSSSTAQITITKVTPVVSAFYCDGTGASGEDVVGSQALCTVRFAASDPGYAAGETATLSSSGTGSFSSTTCILTSIGYSPYTCQSNIYYTPTSVAGSPQTITLTYPGDTYYNPGTWTTQLTVLQAPSSTSVFCPSPVTVGSPSACTVTVTGYGTPSGFVSFTSTGSGLFDSSSCILSSGACSVQYTPESASGSPDSIAASYGGDTNNAVSSSSVQLSVTQVTPAVSVSCTTPVTVGTSSKCQATLSGYFGSISGETITFSTSSTGSFPSFTCLLSGSSCSVLYTPSVAGGHMITASYPGDTNDAVSSGSDLLEVLMAATSVTVSCGTPADAGLAATCQATVAGYPESIAGESISFTTNGTGTFGSSSCTISGSGCSVTYTPEVSGVHLITASYPGDNANAASSSGGLLTVDPFLSAGPPIASSNPSFIYQPVTFTATPSGGSQSYTFTWSGLPADCYPSGSATITCSPSAAGLYSIEYTVKDSNGASATSPPLSFAVSKLAATAVSVSCSSPVLVGSAASCTSTVSGFTGSIGGESISYTTNSTGTFSSSSCTISSDSCSVNYTPGASGTHQITASFAGDSSNAASSGSADLSAELTIPTLSVFFPSSPAVVYQGFYVDAVLLGSNSATGTMTMYEGSTCESLSSNGALGVHGDASYQFGSFESVSPATVYFEASYSGDSANAAVASACAPLSVVAASPALTLVLGYPTIYASGTTYATATLSGATPDAGGSVTYDFFAGGSCSGTASQVGSVEVAAGAVPDSGSQQFIVSGTYSFQATYAGDSVDNPATSNCVSLTVLVLATTITQSLSSPTITVNATAYDIASLQNSYNAGGSVVYSLISGSTCSGEQLDTFTVTVTTGSIPNSPAQLFASAGTFSWQASYGGDQTNAPATSGCAALTVVQPTLSLSPSSCTYGSSCDGSLVSLSGSGYSSGIVYDDCLSATPSSSGCYGDSQGSFTTQDGSIQQTAIALPGGVSAGGYYALVYTPIGGVSSADFTVVPSPTTTSVTCFVNSITIGGVGVNCTATVTGGSGTPTGTIAWSQSSGTGGVTFSSTTCSLSIGTCSITANALSAGRAILQASYEGANSFLASVGVSSPITVLPEPTLTAVSCTSPVIVGTPSTCTATVVGDSPTGVVGSFSSSGSGSFDASSCTLSAGTCTFHFTPTSVSGSPQLISATYGGDLNNSGSSGSSSLTVNQAPSATTLSCRSPVTVGTASTCTITVTGYGTPTGAVNTFISTGSGAFSAPSCTLVGGSCSASYTPTGAAGATHLVSATYEGDTNNQASSGTYSVVVQQEESSTSLTCSAHSIDEGIMTTCTASVTGFSPAGAVYWSQRGPGRVSFSSSQCTLSSVGACSVTVTGTVGGSLTIEASYGGDVNNIGGATSVGLSVFPPVPLTLSFSILGGGVGSSPPVLRYTSGGKLVMVSLSLSSATYDVDSGTAWSVSPFLPGSSSSERWQTNQETSEVADAPVTVTFSYFHQYLQTLSYWVDDGGDPRAPAFSSSSFGSPYSTKLTGSPNGTWFDSGSSWAITNPLRGSGSSERWQTNQATDGTVSSSQTVTFVYFHQYFVSASYAVYGGGSPTAPTCTHMSFGKTLTLMLSETPQGFWADDSPYSMTNPLVSSGTTERWVMSSTSGDISGPGSMVANYYHQFDVTFEYSVSRGGSGYSAPKVSVHQFGSVSIVPTAVSGSAIWVDAWSSYSYPNTLAGSTVTERWFASLTTGSVQFAGIISVGYSHQFSVTISVTGLGSVSPTTGWYNAGQEISITAKPHPGHSFNGWTSSTALIVIAKPAKTTTTATINGSGTITANFS